MRGLGRWAGLDGLTDFARDVRYAIRTVRKSPGFAAVAVLTLGLGIGAATAIYSVVDAILLQPLPFADSDRLVRLVENVPHVVPGRPPVQRGLAYQEFLDWRARSTTLSEFAAITWLGGRVRTEDGTVRLSGAMTTTNLFAMLGTPAALGRTFVPDDDLNPYVAVLTSEAWQRRFRADPAVVGSSLELRIPEQPEGRLLTVIGVLPAGFDFPLGAGVDFFRPLVVDKVFSQYSSDVLARLAPGASLQAAIDEANVIGRTIAPRRADAPPLTVPRFEVQGLKDRLVSELRPALRIFLAAVAVVLLIACANVANLLLARGSARQREIAVRLAMGASRGRVVRQVLTECLVLSTAGGAVGAILGAAGITLVKELASVDAPGIFRFAFSPSLLPRVKEVGIDPQMFVVAFGVAALTSFVFGALPAGHLARTGHIQAMGSPGSGIGTGAARLRGALVVAQLVMATMLLVGAGLLVDSFVKLSAVARGYDPTNVLAFHLVFPMEYSIARKSEAIDAVLDRLRAAPEVVAAGFTRAGMLIREEIFVGTFVPPGRNAEEMRQDPARPRVRPVSEGFLAAMGVPLLDGRELTVDDARAAPPAVVITRSVADRFFPGSSAVGQTVDWHITDTLAVPAQVVGVVGDVRNDAPDREPIAEIFVHYRRLLPLLQQTTMPLVRQDSTAMGLLSFAVRVRNDPAAAAPLVGEIVRSVDPNAGIDSILPMSRLISSSMARPRFYAVLLAVFAAVAAILAAIGVYGVLAYAVQQRTHEIGVRVALGARRGQVLSLVLRQGLTLTAVGIMLGLAAASAGTRVLQGMLFGVTPVDARTFVLAALAFGVVAMLASYVPARRATRIDPVVALRTE